MIIICGSAVSREDEIHVTGRRLDQFCNYPFKTHCNAAGWSRRFFWRCRVHFLSFNDAQLGNLQRDATGFGGF